MKRMVQVCAFILVMMLIIAACSSKDNEGVTNPNTTPDTGDVVKPAEPVVEVKKEPTEVNFVSTNAGLTLERLKETTLDLAAQVYPDYIVPVLRKGEGSGVGQINNLLATGAPIDILIGTDKYNFSYFEANGLMYDMSADIKLHNVDLSHLRPGIIESFTKAGGGKLYGLPTSETVQVMFYNKDIFDRFGVNYPVDGMTWDETIALSRRFNRVEDGVSYLGLAVFLAHNIGANQFSLPFLDKDNKPTFMSTFEGLAGDWSRVLRTLYVEPTNNSVYKDFVSTSNYPTHETFNKEQRVAMFISHNGDVVGRGYADKFNWDLVSMPVFPDLPNIGSQSFTGMYGLASTSKNKEAAMEVLKAIISPEYQLAKARTGTVPVINVTPEVRAAFQADSAYPDKNWDAVFYNRVADSSTLSRYWEDMHQILIRKVPAIIKGEIDINTALRQAQEEGEAFIRTNR